VGKDVSVIGKASGGGQTGLSPRENGHEEGRRKINLSSTIEKNCGLLRET